MRRVLLVAALLGFLPAMQAAEYQWSVEVPGGREGAGPARAFLWIPPKGPKVRAVLLAQQNLEEESILENPKFRAALADLGFAEVFCSPAFDHLFRFNEGAGEMFTQMMNDLAGISGYEELKTAPVVGLGHSASASWPYYFAAWQPARALAAISVSGQWPYVRNAMFCPDIWGDRKIDYIPCLESMGEYESADSWSGEGLHERQQYPLLPLSMLANPGQGHFASTDAKVEYLELYLKKAAQYRLSDSSAELRRVDPTKTGWVVDKWRRNQPPAAPAAPVRQYKGDPKEAFWYFDEEMARATETYQAVGQGLKVQLLGYRQKGELVPQHNTHQQVDLKFLPQDDGITFKLDGTFLETVPGESPRPKDWTELPVGAPVGHANGGAISIDRLCGPFAKLSDDTFAIQLRRGSGSQSKTYELWFAATHPGDTTYKAAVQQAQMKIPFRNTEGEPQTITFAKPPDVKLGTREVALKATSNARAKVQFYVREGPAEVEGDHLKLTEIPPRAKFPIQITVVAWQYGRSIEPKLQSAEPVEQTFSVTR